MGWGDCFNETHRWKEPNTHFLWASKLPERGKGAELLISGFSFQSHNLIKSYLPGVMMEQRKAKGVLVVLYLYIKK